MDEGKELLTGVELEEKWTLEKLKSNVPDTPEELQVFPPAAGALQGRDSLLVCLLECPFSEHSVFFLYSDET